MTDPARIETLAALAILRERLLQAVDALDAARVALDAEAAPALAPPVAAEPLSPGAPTVAELAQRFEVIREQLAALGVRSATPPA